MHPISLSSIHPHFPPRPPYGPYLLSNNHTHYSYAVLGLEVGSTLIQVKQRWKLMVKHYHPDKNVGYEDARYVFGRVHEAYHKIKGVDDSGRNNVE